MGPSLNADEWTFVVYSLDTGYTGANNNPEAQPDPAPPKPDVKLPNIKRPVERIPPGTLPVVPEKEDPNKPIKICE